MEAPCPVSKNDVTTIVITDSIPNPAFSRRIPALASYLRKSQKRRVRKILNKMDVTIGK